MANFYTHLSVSGGLGILGITFLCGASLVTSNESLCLISLCILGGLIPDIDSDSDTSIMIISKLFSGLCAFLITFPYLNKFAILISLGLFILSYLVLRFGILTLISYCTKHRGLIHTIPSAFLVCFTTSIVLYDIFNTGVNFSWLGASFILIGYLSHLILDEFISENLAGEPIDRPRGKTFQVFGFKNRQWIFFVGLYIAVGILYLFTPSFNPFSQYLFSEKTGKHIEHRLFSGSLPVELEYLSDRGNNENNNINNSDIIDI